MGTIFRGTYYLHFQHTRVGCTGKESPDTGKGRHELGMQANQWEIMTLGEAVLSMSRN
jgi:hypothetical protein